MADQHFTLNDWRNESTRAFQIDSLLDDMENLDTKEIKQVPRAVPKVNTVQPKQNFMHPPNAKTVVHITSTPSQHTSKTPLDSVGRANSHPINNNNTLKKVDLNQNKFYETEELLKLLSTDLELENIPKVAQQHQQEPVADKKPTDAFGELLMCEKNYVNGLETLLDNFAKLKEILTPQVLHDISINIEYIFQYHKDVLNSLSKDKSISNLILTFSPEKLTLFEQIYTIYFGNYQNSLQVYNDLKTNNVNFKKFITQQNSSKDIIYSLLVSPINHINLYANLLKNIINDLPKNLPDHIREESNILKIRVQEFKNVLLKIEYKRLEVDKWERINQLEKSLSTLKPLTRTGRYIVQEFMFLTRIRTSSGLIIEDTFKYILFNDSLMRIKPTNSRSSKKARVLDLVPLSQVQIIEYTSDEDFSLFEPLKATSQSPIHLDHIHLIFYVVNSDPTSKIWEIQASNLKEKLDCLQALSSYLPSQNLFKDQWKIEQDQKIITADACKWTNAYAGNCRLYLTNSYILILYKIFGYVEREIIPIGKVIFFEKTKGKKGKDQLTIIADTSKKYYHFSSVHNLPLTHFLLEQMLNSWKLKSLNLHPKQPPPVSHTILDQSNSSYRNSFSLTADEWNEVWKSSNLIELKENEELLPTLLEWIPTNPLYKVLKGSIVKSNRTYQEGELFGVVPFLTGKSSDDVIAAGNSGATILQLFRANLYQRYSDNPLFLSQFFATLSLEMTPL